MKDKKKAFDAVAFMRKRREELSRAYAGLSAEQIEQRIQQELKDDPLWRRQSQTNIPSSSRKKTVAVPSIRSARSSPRPRRCTTNSRGN